MWSENNLNWIKTSAALTDSDIGFFPFPPPKHSLFYEYTVSQSSVSWWLNKLFDFWIILRLTEFEMWAACNVLLAQKDELCYWQKNLQTTFFIIIRLCWTRVHFSLARLPGWALRGQVQKCNLQSSLSTLVTCHAAHTGWLLPGRPNPYFLPQSRNIVHYIRFFEISHNIPNE